MFRNQYDSDVTVWSPQGRLHQVEYAMEAVKQGSATVGLKNGTHAVLVALKRASSELSAHQKKIYPIDDHIGITISGLTADARILCRYMRTECLNHKYSHDALLPVSRLIANLGNKMQVCTQRYDRRPYGVGLLVAGYDDQGPHVYQTCPSANFFNCKAMAVGSRSQSARTYLEKHFDEFPTCPTEELIKHGLRALRDTLPNEVELSAKNVSIGLVGKGAPFRMLDEEQTAGYLRMVEGEEKRTTGGESQPEEAPQPPPGDDAPPRDPVPAVAMDTD
ncbi:proteasome subunit alpha type-1-like [Bacillus rossius redtenbacheri]|uniref:proteasome subunit alpha type-1-like n=1 Tax=Bacillus rossius redtenbacheri TaxID=93214 RepID=UPI002FDC8788